MLLCLSSSAPKLRVGSDEPLPQGEAAEITGPLLLGVSLLDVHSWCLWPHPKLAGLSSMFYCSSTASPYL